MTLNKFLKIKHEWPLAMQSQNRSEFESILAKDFTFKGIGEFFNREDYIKNRIKPDDWKITFVKYDNLSLQFIDNLAVLSYKNRIKDANNKTNEVEVENISWIDVYVQESRKRKIQTSHALDYKLEKQLRSYSSIAFARP